jgi:hypothetical protein
MPINAGLLRPPTTNNTLYSDLALKKRQAEQNDRRLAQGDRNLSLGERSQDLQETEFAYQMQQDVMELKRELLGDLERKEFNDRRLAQRDRNLSLSERSRDLQETEFSYQMKKDVIELKKELLGEVERQEFAKGINDPYVKFLVERGHEVEAAKYDHNKKKLSFEQQQEATRVREELFKALAKVPTERREAALASQDYTNADGSPIVLSKATNDWIDALGEEEAKNKYVTTTGEGGNKTLHFVDAQGNPTGEVAELPAAWSETVPDPESKTKWTEIFYDSQNKETHRTTVRRPLTADQSQGVASFSAWRKLITEIGDAERSINALQSYAKTAIGSSQGFMLFADELVSKIHAFFGSSTFNDMDQTTWYSTLQGPKLQPLIGLFKNDVVGTGPVTEFDAERILWAMGGDISIFRDRKVVATVIRDHMKEKIRKYNEELMPLYNEQIEIGRFSGKTKELRYVDESLFNQVLHEGPKPGEVVGNMRYIGPIDGDRSDASLWIPKNQPPPRDMQ